MEKYKLVGTVEPCGLGEQEWESKPILLWTVYQGEDGKYYGAYIDERTETPWAINGFGKFDDDLASIVHFIDDNTELEIDNEYYKIGDIPVAALKKDDGSRYIGRIDKWVDAMKDYKTELIDNHEASEGFIAELDDNIEYLGGIVAKGKEAKVFECKILTKKMN